MKSFQEFIIEKNRKDYGRKGGEGGVKGTRITPSDRSDARARIQDTSYSTPSRGQRATPATPSELMSDATVLNSPNATDPTPSRGPSLTLM